MYGYIYGRKNIAHDLREANVVAEKCHEAIFKQFEIHHYTVRRTV